MGDIQDLLTSSIFFMGTNMNHRRVEKINRKMETDGTYKHFYRKVQDLHMWVQYMKKNQMKHVSDEEVEEIKTWTKKMIEKTIPRQELARWVNDHANM